MLAGMLLAYAAAALCTGLSLAHWRFPPAQCVQGGLMWPVVLAALLC